MLRRVLSRAALVACVAGSLASCGQSFSGDAGDGDEGGTSSGAGGTSGNSSGGTSSGGTSSGGTSSGGTSSGGASSGGRANGGTGNSPAGGSSGASSGNGGAVGGGMTGGAAGAGGEPGSCSLPPEPGDCNGSLERFAFNPATGVCQPFIYGGCGGNANNFATAESCYGACGGQGQIDPAVCDYPTDCTWVPASCCGCALPNVGTVIAVARTHVAELKEAMGCNLVDCDACQPVANPWLGSTCRGGRCVAFDVRRTELATCEMASDCRFRAGVECCENCTAPRQAFIAINADADERAWFCGDAPVGCAGCVPIVPQNLSLVCQSGTCGVLDAELPQ